MSRPDEPLSTRDLASSPAEHRGEPDAQDSRQDPETGARDDDATSVAEATPASPSTDDAVQPRGERDANVTEPGAEASAELAEPAAEPAPDDGQAPLLAEHEGAELGSRWESIQATFVDDPRRAVEEADGLVANVMQQLADGFARERETLEGQWSRGEDVSTEDLRVALQRYRSFFQRLLSA
ncbi:MAG TPA: hypothetical protein VES79_10400 [Solirubrobacteraceae bacterium]|nr:hypothetical protein [Solirubrobacteraceae bacterium]